MTHSDSTTSDPVENDSRTEPYQVRHQWESGQSLISTIVYAIADISNQDPCDIRPLGETLDVEALEEFAHQLSEKENCNTSYISFPFEKWVVTAYATGKIVISVSK